MINIFWFRRDLRLEDNAALALAMQDGHEILPIFIFDPNILNTLAKDDARVSFVHRLLSDIQAQLGKKGRALATFKGKPEAIFKRLISENRVHAVYTNHDYEPYAKERDEAIQKLLAERDVKFITAKDQVIFEPPKTK